jgi:hypothetical protein
MTSKRNAWGLFLLCAIAGSAQAQVITACSNNVNGELRRVTSAAACRNNESAVNWSVQGAQGP